MKNRGLLLVLLVVALAAGAAFLLWRNHPREVEVAAVRSGRAVDLVYATGYVESDQPVSISSRLTAPVTEVLVREGDRVAAGQPLILLDDSEQRGLLEQAAAQRRNAELTEQRTLALYAKGWVTRAARDTAVAAAQSARAAEQAAKARLGQNVIRAGGSGIILKRDVEPGDLAVPSRVLMTFGDPARMRVTATVDERDIMRVKPGQKALMSSDAWRDRVIEGMVRSVTPGGDPNQRSFRVRLGVTQAMELPYGLTLEVNIVTREVDRTLLAPTSAITAGYVWLVEDGRLRKRAVRAGITGPDEVEILSGLRAGDKVVVLPATDMQEGERVRVASAAAR